MVQNLLDNFSKQHKSIHQQLFSLTKLMLLEQKDMIQIQEVRN